MDGDAGHGVLSVGVKLRVRVDIPLSQPHSGHCSSVRHYYLYLACFALLERGNIFLDSVSAPELLHAVLVQAVRGGHHRAGVDESAAADVPAPASSVANIFLEIFSSPHRLSASSLLSRAACQGYSPNTVAPSPVLHK